MVARRKPSNGPVEPGLKLYITIAGIIGALLTVYIAYRASISERNFFSIGMLAMLAGLLFESFRVLENKRSIFGTFIFAYLFSLIAFIPGKREHNYNFEQHLEGWPYFFLVIYALFFVIIHKDRFTAKLNEGITLVLSLSLIYWALDFGVTRYHNWFSISVMTIGILLCMFSIAHAVTYMPLTRTVRLTLSIWSSIILSAFAIDNMAHVFSNPEIENSKYLSEAVFTGIQYFLVGVAAIYIMRNFLLLVSFLPSKNGNYKREIREGKQEHMERYSDKQARIVYSVVCIVFVGLAYWLNHRYQILPGHTAILLVFFAGTIIWRFLDKPSEY
ncbi:hypothetical protein [Fluviicola sp.]|uniref:hypothetical protein n=1 Tax=Fluviicola sp. TaxID=1917219 RepID=UPI0031E2931E